MSKLGLSLLLITFEMSLSCFGVSDLNPTRASPARLNPRDLDMTAAIDMVGRPKLLKSCL